MHNRAIPVPFDEERSARQLLGQAGIFKDLDAAAISDLARRVTIRRVASGTVVVAQDEAGDSLYVVQSGRCKAVLFGETGREVTLRLLRPGEIFGELSLFDGRPRSANVIAVGDSTLLVLGRDALQAHLRLHPATGLRLLAELAARLRQADEMIGNLALHDVPARIIRTLVGLARDEGSQPESDGLLLRSKPTQQELANMVGTCRETVSRAFSALLRRGLVQPRGSALLLSPKLVSMAGGAPARAA